MVARGVAALAGALLVATATTGPVRADGAALLWFEQYMQALRAQAGIPGMSVALAGETGVIWERGFGVRDVETGVPATPDTPYLIGDLSRLFAGTLLLRCVEEGRAALESPLPVGAEAAATPSMSVGRTLAQIAGEPPAFRYDAAGFSALTATIETCRERPYRLALMAEIFGRLAMIDSVPSRDADTADAFPPDTVDDATLRRHADVIARLAHPHAVDRRGRAARSTFPDPGVNAATGVISTVRDLARFERALNDGILLRPSTLQVAWTPPLLGDATVSPYGFGWFVQFYLGQPVIWHFGVIPDGGSGLFIKLPSRRLTLIVLANGDGLVVPYELERGDVTSSPFARLFLRLFAT